VHIPTLTHLQMTTVHGYELRSAGWAGFSQVLPVYPDHVLLPSLTDAAFSTEVHHIDETGHNAAIVYSEMEADTFTRYYIVRLDAYRQIYPEGNGYRYEKGSICKDIRHLTNQKVQQFRKTMYQTKSLRIVITGETDHKNLFRVISKFEDSILRYVASYAAPFVRPWSSHVPDPILNRSITNICEFPWLHGDLGYVYIALLGLDMNDVLGSECIAEFCRNR
jgi:Zn-dependent M16 (insulinase) family peptidase